MEKVFVTGHKGSIGKELTKKLKEEGYEVFVAPENSRLGDANYFSLAENESISAIYHLASKSFVPASWDDPLGFYSANVLGTGYVLEFCRENSIPLIYISSYVYGSPEFLPINESHPVKTPNPYAISKVHAENLIQFYGENFGLKFNIIRPFNIYGSLEKKEMLVPEIVEQIETKNKIVVNDLKPKRDQLHISDFIELLIASKNEFHNTAYNAGSGVSYSVQEIVDTCQLVWKSNLDVVDRSAERKNEISETICDFSKAQAAFGWKPKISLVEGLTMMFQTYKTNK